MPKAGWTQRASRRSITRISTGRDDHAHRHGPPNRYAEKVGDVWYKRGADWGDSEDQPLTRFSLYSDIMVESGREEIPNSKEYICTEYRRDGTCRNGYWTAPDYTYTTSQFASWQGCVEARPVPYNNNDATPTTSEPATLFVPMFAPDEAKHLWRDLDRDGVNDLNGDSFGYGNNWWADWADTDATARQADMRKYFRVKPYGSTNPGSGDGPNFSCTTSPITPLTDVTKSRARRRSSTAIDAMKPTGNTNVPEGTAWGWRVVSSGEPFTEGRPDTEKGNDKVIIVLTDGANTYGDQGGDDDAKNKSTYAAYGYIGKKYGSTGTTRLFNGTSATVSKTDYTASNYPAALDEQMRSSAQTRRHANVLVMTVSLDLSEKTSEERRPSRRSRPARRTRASARATTASRRSCSGTPRAPLCRRCSRKSPTNSPTCASSDNGSLASSKAPALVGRFALSRPLCSIG